MLEVAVIGAGSAGIVSARHLLAAGLKCTIFDTQKAIGGAWSSSSSSTRKVMWNGLHTNLSKHTCRFSDFPWTLSELYPGSTPTFPSQVDMDRYLHSYAEEHIDPDCFNLDCQVTKISSSPSSDDSEGYQVEWIDNNQKQHVKVFGGVIIATGFFSKPYMPPGLSSLSSSTTKSNNDKNNNSPIKIIHSQDYGCHEQFANETVAVVGNSFSALEIAVDVSQSAKRVVSILPNIPWVVPRYVPTKSSSSTTTTTTTSMVLPIDLAFYQRTDPAFSKEAMTSMTPEMCRQRHQALQQMLGSRQESVLGIPNNFETPPMVAVSDYFLDLVADNTIEVIHGRAQEVDDTGLKVSKITTSSDDTKSNTAATVVLPNIDTIICCTGFLPNLQSYLDPSMLQILEYNPDDLFSPMTACWQTVHPKLKNMAFCGMYRGSYMGLVEQQARLAAKVISGQLNLTDEQYQKALDTSREIRTQNPRPQFPQFDYIGCMDSLARILSSSLPKWNTNVGDIVTPAFYQPDDEIAKGCISELEDELEKGRKGSHIPFLVMSALIGSWDFDRTIVHFSNNNRERVHGKIRYSRPKLDYVLYREDGLYQISEFKSLPVFREYEYICNGDMLEIYFVEGGQRAHLFLSLKFQEQTSDGYWIATSDHLCIKDLYKANFKIKLEGVKATELIISYRVKGPSKDYEAVTVMSPCDRRNEV